MFEIRANADIALDIHHDEMLAVTYGPHADISACLRHAGCVDHDIDQSMRQGKVQILCDGDPSRFHRGGHLVVRGNVLRMTRFAIGQLCTDRRAPSRTLHNGADTNALHLGNLGEDVGPHLAGPNETDADGFARRCAFAQFSGEACQCNIGRRYRHEFSGAKHAEPAASIRNLLHHRKGESNREGVYDTLANPARDHKSRVGSVS